VTANSSAVVLDQADFSAGLQLWRGDSDFASLNPALAFTMLLLKYAPMASSIDKSNQYTVSLLTLGRKTQLTK
jgi:hypothetical protein